MKSLQDKLEAQSGFAGDWLRDAQDSRTTSEVLSIEYCWSRVGFMAAGLIAIQPAQRQAATCHESTM
jgi:hypothetical protein